MLSEKKEHYEKTGKMLKVTPAKYKKEYEWLKEVDSLALCNAQLHLEAAYKNFFRDPSVGYPKYKRKHGSRASYTTNRVNGNIRIEGGKIRLPKVGEVRIRIHREAEKEWELKAVTISRETTGRYYASILYQTGSSENQERKVRTEKMLGIDYAMQGLGVFSDGRRAEYPMYYRKAEKKLKREQRKLSHCEKGSRNYGKQKKRLAKAHARVRNQRNDYQHKLSNQLAEEYDLIAVEDLNMKGMSQALHFGKSVMDNGYGEFLRKLEYKLEQRGKVLIRIDRYYPSSKRCSRCGKVKEEMKLSEREYRCSCGNQMDRDVNAAINIREEGKRIYKAS